MVRHPSGSFEEIKELFIKPPILHLPRPGGGFIVYCDTSKPAPITPGRKVINPAVRWTPSQTPLKSRLKSPSSSTNKTPRSLLNTPEQSHTPLLNNTPSLAPGTQQTAHQQTPARSQPINKIPISPAQAVSRKLIQRSVKLLNAPKHKLSSRPFHDLTPNVKLFPSTDASIHPGNESLEVSQPKYL